MTLLILSLHSTAVIKNMSLLLACSFPLDSVKSAVAGWKGAGYGVAMTMRRSSESESARGKIGQRLRGSGGGRRWPEVGTASDLNAVSHRHAERIVAVRREHAAFIIFIAAAIVSERQIRSKDSLFRPTNGVG